MVYYQQALSLERELSDKAREATTLNSLGLVYSALSQPRKALEFYFQALPLRRESGDKPGEARTLNNIGSVYSNTGHPQQGLAFYQQSLSLEREVGDSSGAAITLASLGTLAADQHHLAQAASYLRQSIAFEEGKREDLGGQSDFKTSFLFEKLFSYYKYMDVLLQQQQQAKGVLQKQRLLAEAFEWAQKSKARSLLDLMAGGKVEVSNSETSEEHQREQQLQQTIHHLNTELVAVAVQPNRDTAKLALLKQQLAKTDSDLQTFTNDLYTNHPDLANKRSAKTLQLADAATFLPADTALLEYVSLQARMGSRTMDKMVLFCVTLDKGKPLLKAYPLSLPVSRLSERAANFCRLCADPQAEYTDTAESLSSLLIAPAAKQIMGRKRLLVCPDGPLWGLPFQALMRKGKSGNDLFLAQQFEVDYGYSATAVQAAWHLKTNSSVRSLPGRYWSARTLILAV